MPTYKEAHAKQKEALSAARGVVKEVADKIYPLRDHESIDLHKKLTEALGEMDAVIKAKDPDDEPTPKKVAKEEPAEA